MTIIEILIISSLGLFLAGIISEKIYNKIISKYESFAFPLYLVIFFIVYLLVVSVLMPDKKTGDFFGLLELVIFFIFQIIGFFFLVPKTSEILLKLLRYKHRKDSLVDGCLNILLYILFVFIIGFMFQKIKLTL